MEMPRPGAAHRKLERLAGFWRGEERVHPTPLDPSGGAAVGRVRNRMALDDFALIHEYEQERDGAVRLRGHGVLRWDPEDETYALHWFDSLGMRPTEFRGQFEGDILTLTTEDPRGWVRAVWDFGEHGHYTFLMETSRDGEEWWPLMEGEYIREG